VACTSLAPPPSTHIVWQPIAPGLQRALMSPWPDSVVHVLRLDLREPTLRLQVSPWAERGQALDTMPSAVAALASVNASFFDRNFTPRGWTVSDGHAWPQALAIAASPLLACDRQQRCEIVFTPPTAAAPAWFNAVAGTPWLLNAGVARSSQDDSNCEALCARPHPRTAIGLDAARRQLWIVTVEGRRPPVLGVGLAPLAAFMLSLGVSDAINLDGGGSSAVFVQSQSVMARPANEPAQRHIANAIHLRAVP
jgi:Phosphodiester glycosidase